MTNGELIKIAMQTGIDIDENDNITGGTVDALQKLRLRLLNHNKSDTSPSATVSINVDLTKHIEKIDTAKKVLAAVTEELHPKLRDLWASYLATMSEALSVLEYNWENYPEAGSQSDLETIQKLRALLSDDTAPAATASPVTTMAIDVQAGQFVISDSNGNTCVVLGNLGGLDKSITNMVQNDYLKI